ncbi:MAG: NfeD family protein [Acidobacteria bacterium]|jgi:inner membrane protein|nr:MAG: NfeD family protein [Acidobacteriota bacterium]
MTWWQWLVVGLVLVGLEMAAAGGFYIIFFGIAAIAIAGLRIVDLAGPAWFQLLLFSVISVGSLILFRQRLLRQWQVPGAPADIDSLVGDTAFALGDISPGAVGKVELRGTTWDARNSTASVITKGSRCTVIRTSQLTLFVRPEEVPT